MCGSCARSFVVPHQILEVLPFSRDYVVELRCNSCDWVHVGTFDEASMEALDRALDNTQGQLRRASEALTAKNMAESIEAFVTALRDDLILPEDF